jgi:hypothetical protein
MVFLLIVLAVIGVLIVVWASGILLRRTRHRQAQKRRNWRR